jgi:hypothetical protein
MEHFSPGFVAGEVVAFIGKFALERREEALNRRVASEISLADHRAEHAALSEPLAVAMHVRADLPLQIRRNARQFRSSPRRCPFFNRIPAAAAIPFAGASSRRSSVVNPSGVMSAGSRERLVTLRVSAELPDVGGRASGAAPGRRRPSGG